MSNDMSRRTPSPHLAGPASRCGGVEIELGKAHYYSYRGLKEQYDGILMLIADFEQQIVVLLPHQSHVFVPRSVVSFRQSHLLLAYVGAGTRR